MASLRCKIALLWTAAVLLGLVGLLFLGVFIVLAAVGIILSGQANFCSTSSPNEDCTKIYSLDGVVASDAPDATETHLWVMVACTVEGIVTSIVITLCMWGILSITHKVEDLNKEKDKLKKSGKDPLAESHHHEAADKLNKDETDHGVVEGGTGKLSEEDSVEILADVVGVYVPHEWQKEPLRYASPCSLVTLFFANLCAGLGSIFLVWGIAISYDYTRRQDERSVGAFILVDALIGLLMPIFFIVGAILMASFLSFITNNHLDGRKSVSRFLPSVRFMEAEYYNYWVIEDTFYFKMKRRTNFRENGYCYACDKSSVTWQIVAVIFLTILLSFSYFVDQSVVRSQTVSKCSDVPAAYECFNSTTLDYVDCSRNDTITTPIIHCFQFLEFGRDVSIISSLAESFAFYLATVVFFRYIFAIVKVLLYVKPTKLWGVPFILLGIVMVLGAIILLAVSDVVRIELNVITVMQFFMISLFILIVGALLVQGKWFELVPAHKFPKPLNLARYDSTSRRRLADIEQELTEHPVQPASQPRVYPATPSVTTNI